MSSLPTVGSQSTLATSSTMSSISESRRRFIFHPNSSGIMTFRWMIPNFRPNEEKCYVQRVFTNDGDFGWKLTLHTCYEDIDYTTFNVCLKNNATNRESVQVSIELAIVKPQNQRMYVQSIQRNFVKDEEHIVKFIKRDSFISENLLEGRNLVLEFKIEVINTKTIRALKHQVELITNMQKYLWPDVFHKIYLTFTDVILTIDKKEVMRAHSNILAMRSVLFRQKLIAERLNQKGCSDFYETPNVIFLEINDIKYEMLMAVIEYIYRGKVDGIEHLARDLLLVSRLYVIKKLEILCEDALVDSLNVENAADLLIYAHVYASDEAEGYDGTSKLKHMALEFIKKNRQVARTDGFKRIVDFPDLVVTLVEFL